MLLALAVDVRADVEALGILDLVCGDDPRSLRGKRVEPLAVEPVEPLVARAAVSALLDDQLALGHVVHNGVPSHVSERVLGFDALGLAADDYGQLALPVDAIGDRGNEDAVAGANDGSGRRLHKDARGFLVLGIHFAAALFNVVLVVAGQAEHLARVGHGSAEADLAKGVDGLAVGFFILGVRRGLFGGAQALGTSAEQRQHVGKKGMRFALFLAGQDAVGGSEINDHRVVGYNGTDELFASGRVRG